MREDNVRRADSNPEGLNEQPEASWAQLVKISRRKVLQAALFGTAAAALGPILDACGAASTSPPAALTPRRGGHLRVGFTGGGSSDTVDAHAGITYPDYARLAQLYNPLTTLGPNAETQYELAESITSDATATQWTIKLRSGITFHNGKSLTADDLIFTFRRILNPKSPQPGALPLGPVDLTGLKKLDNLTVLVPMTSPYASFIDQLSYFYFLYVVPEGYDPTHPVGTGPFTFQSFTPGSQSVFVRNPNYWKSGRPYVDDVTIIDFADNTAMVNALIGGQLDAAGNIEGTQAKALQANGALRTLHSQSAVITPFTMRVDQPPFNDVRVRQAFRLMANRPQMVEVALSGYGTVGNDVSSPFDNCYDRSLQRSQDLAQAKSLLKQAGQDGITVELVTAPIANGTVEAAQTFAAQAAGAGAHVNIRQVTNDVLFGSQYLSWPFSQDWYYYSPYLAQVAQSLLPGSPFNETHYSNPQYVSLYNSANKTTDASQRCQIVHEMQALDFNEGGYIIASYNWVNDAYTPKLHGLVPYKPGEPLSGYGFDAVWFE